MPDGYIKLHRKLLEWEWVDDPNTFCVFIHLLLRACYKEYRWHGMTLQPGQLVIGRRELAAKSGVSEQSVRTSLDRLKSTHSITIESTREGSLVTIVKWRDYQCYEEDANPPINPQINHEVTQHQPSINPASTTREEIKKERREEGKENINPIVVNGGFLSDAEQGTLGTAYRDNMAAIEAKARSLSMPPWGAADDEIATRLMADYTAERLLEAMGRAAKGKSRTWGYIEGILKNWRTKGGIDNEPGSFGGRAAGNTGADKAGAPASIYAGLYNGEV